MCQHFVLYTPRACLIRQLPALTLFPFSFLLLLRIAVCTAYFFKGGFGGLQNLDLERECGSGEEFCTRRASERTNAWTGGNSCKLLRGLVSRAEGVCVCVLCIKKGEGAGLRRHQEEGGEGSSSCKRRRLVSLSLSLPMISKEKAALR